MTIPPVTAPGRVWFITGASSGFGLLMAQKALASGEKVVATLRKPEVPSDLRSQYTEKQLLVLAVDVTKAETVLAAFAAAEKAFGRIDLVFNNAGYGIAGEIEGTSEEKARHQFETNFWGALTVTKEAVRVFREVNKPMGGKLLVMSSMFGVDAPPGAGFYAATKFATEAVTDSLAKELDPEWNIKIMILCPGWFKTNMTLVNAVVEPVHPAYAGKEQLASIQVRRLFVDLIRGDSPALQDATKLINKIWALSNAENPPYRVAFGEDAKGAFTAKWTALKSDLEASEEWSKDLTYSL
ncbi:NAD(P)-binding protein [Mycena filopes]|nr:NAD(P)-binding protein [Mycena filopes]